MQVSLRSKPIFHLFSGVSWTRLKGNVTRFLSQKQQRKMVIWFLGATGTTLMLGWNWQLVCATLAGVSFMRLLHSLQTGSWQPRWLHWRNFFESSQGKLAIAVSGGGCAVISSYIALVVWSNAENRWLATGLILQGLGTFLILGLLVWQLLDGPRKKQANQHQEWISQLTDSNPLKRLIAVQSLSNLLANKQLTKTENKQLLGYFYVMLNQETDMVIRQALLEGCQISDQM
ncbi:MAG: hypothetical protein AB4062_09490 [Crocosphaera sp.]